MTTTATEPTDADSVSPRIAVAIPCYNEAAAISVVIARFQSALPEAEIVVFDNNSTDGSGELAQALGVRVVAVPEQGKGHAVRAAFAALDDFDLIVLTDGDGTYPADAAAALIAPVLAGEADMSVGARRPAPGAGAMSPVRGLGNLLIRSAFWALIGPGNSDLLSGYRVFNRRYRESVSLSSSGFEIETELAAEAAAHKLRVVEIPVEYHPRIVGTQSKLRAVRDGARIIGTIVMESLRLRPHRLIVFWIAICGVIGLSIPWGYAATAGLGLLVFWGVVVMEIRRHRRQDRRRAH